ncbi:hypothetical protein [Staphylococcus aureus]|uniref:hypothetical protein n=1 Tax=Staphylococcus aureus TaxID=1280 RepID=UPI000DE437AE|nr:hypothetical protein [Staphylococcus aureus]
MKFTQDTGLWAIIKNAYFNNDSPFLFFLFNLFFFIVIAIAIYGAYKWKTDSKNYRLMTLSSIVVLIFFLIYSFAYLTDSKNQIGNYTGKVDIAFTSDIKDNDIKVARISDNSNNNLPINSFVMNSKDMNALNIRSGKTIEINAPSKPAPKDGQTYLELDKSDVKNVKDSTKISDYNKEQQSKEEQEAKAKEKEKEKKKKDK